VARAILKMGSRVGNLPRTEFAAAACVLGRGMRDNPLLVAAYGPDPIRREEVHGRLMKARLYTARDSAPLGAWHGDTLVACAGVVWHGGRRAHFGEWLPLLPIVGRLGPRTAGRLARWLLASRACDPDESHVHLGPLAVDRHLGGQGIGSVLLAEHCRRLDAAGALGYLETDTPENVRFFAKQGYRVVSEARMIGVGCWRMCREPRP